MVSFSLRFHVAYREVNLWEWKDRRTPWYESMAGIPAAIDEQMLNRHALMRDVRAGHYTCDALLGFQYGRSEEGVDR